MKPHTILIMSAVLLIGFLIGRVSSPFGIFERDPDDVTKSAPFRTRAAERGSTPTSGTPFSLLRKEIRSAPSDQCGELLRKVLETPDPFERSALFYDLMARMDAGNFIEMSEAPAGISLETGRDNYSLWRLAHERAGQVAGPLAMARWVEQSALGGPRAEFTMWGWATQDPDAARKWLDEQERRRSCAAKGFGGGCEVAFAKHGLADPLRGFIHGGE